MAIFLANKINTTEGDLTGPTAHAQLKDKKNAG